jgi:hypothetical protein
MHPTCHNFGIVVRNERSAAARRDIDASFFCKDSVNAGCTDRALP